MIPIPPNPSSSWNQQTQHHFGKPLGRARSTHLRPAFLKWSSCCAPEISQVGELGGIWGTMAWRWVKGGVVSEGFRWFYDLRVSLAWFPRKGWKTPVFRVGAPCCPPLSFLCCPPMSSLKTTSHKKGSPYDSNFPSMSWYQPKFFKFHGLVSINGNSAVLNSKSAGWELQGFRGVRAIASIDIWQLLMASSMVRNTQHPFPQRSWHISPPAAGSTYQTSYKNRSSKRVVVFFHEKRWVNICSFLIVPWEASFIFFWSTHLHIFFIGKSYCWWYFDPLVDRWFMSWGFIYRLW